MNNKPFLIPLPRVCRLWNHSTTPLLYRRLSTYFTGVHSSRRRKRLLETIRDRPKFYSYIRDLQVQKADEKERPDAEILEKAAASIKNLGIKRVLAVDINDHILDKITPLALDALVMSGFWCQPTLDLLLQKGLGDSPRTLELNSYCRHDEHSGARETSVQPHTSTVASFVIEMSCWSTEALLNVISLPQSLRFLKIDMTAVVRSWSTCQDTACYTTQVQQALDIHRESLQEIEMSGFWEDDNGQVIDLSKFPNVVAYSLHYSNLLPISPEEACQKLPCPKLERMSIDMNWNDQQTEAYERIDVDWLLEFVRLRREKLPIDKLRDIHIEYRWNDDDVRYDYSNGYIHESPWPSEYLETAAERFKELGIRLSWPEPHWSREVWESISREQTIPGWKYTNTKEERMQLKPPTEEEIKAYRDSFHVG